MMDHDQLFGMLQPGMDGRYYYVRKRGEISIQMISRSDDPAALDLAAMILHTPYGCQCLDLEVDDGLEVLALVPTCEELVARADPRGEPQGGGSEGPKDDFAKAFPVDIVWGLKTGAYRVTWTTDAEPMVVIGPVGDNK